MAYQSPSIGSSDKTSGSKGLKPVSQLKTADDLERQLDTLCKQRNAHEQQWKINLAFYKGKQYVYYNKASRRIEQLPVADGEKPRYRVRIVSNQILPGCHQMLASFTKTKPVMHATPGSGSDADLKAAGFAEKLLAYLWNDLQLDDALEEAILWSLVCGQGYWEIRWDDYAGKQMSFMLDPQGNPIFDPAFAEIYLQHLQVQGVQPEQQTVFMGDIAVDVISPFDLYVDPTVKKFTDAAYVIKVMYLDPDAVYARYGKNMTADSVNAPPDATLPVGNSDSLPNKNVVKLAVGYFKPGPTLPEGRVVTWCKDEILADDKWSDHYPFDDLPVVKFPGIRVPGEVYDTSVVQHAIPLQKELNKTLSQIVEYKNLTITPRVWAPVGSMRQRLTREPGRVYEFTPIGGLRPEVETLPTMPPYVFEHLQEISGRINDIFNSAEVLQGQVPPNVEAATAIDLLQEMATDRIAPTIRLMEMALARAGRLMLDLAKARYMEPRMMKITGANGSAQVKEFSAADIQGAVDVVVEAGSGLPRTRAGKQARVEWLIQNQLLPPQYAYKYLDLADLTGATALMQLDEDQAGRENDKLAVGQPTNPTALAQAQQQMQQLIQQFQTQGMADPDGQPQSGDEITDPGQLQQYIQQQLQQAAIAPNRSDNHQVHMDVHARYMKSVEYETLAQTDPQAAQSFIDHYNAHIDIYFSMPVLPEPVAPRVTYQIKGDVGPTTAADILQRSGVNVDPQTLATEPPMTTWVSTDTHEATPESVAQEEQQAQQAQIAQQQADQQAASAAQQMQHAQQKHDAHMAHAHAKLIQQIESAKPKPPQGGKGGR